MYARLGFSIAAHVDSEILLVDEVLSVGDYLFRKRCMERMKEIVYQGAAIIFVSHDLDAISNFCARVILLDRGKIVSSGSPQDVIAAYFEAGRGQDGSTRKKDVFVSRVAIRGADGPRSNFMAGDDAWFDVEVTANRRMERLVLTVYLRDARNIDIFYASMLRLGLPTFALEAGETREFTVHLKLHLAGGAFLVGVDVYSCDKTLHAQGVEKSDAGPFRIYDDRFPVGTLLIHSPCDVGGLANLYPEISMGRSRGLGLRLACPGDPTFYVETGGSMSQERHPLLIGAVGDMPADNDDLVANS
jgi:hypothetical protein